MKVISIQTGSVQSILYKDKPWPTAIFKSDVEGPIFLDKLGLHGDQQGNLNVHGGEGRALYVFARSTYDLWKNKIQDDLLSKNGLFGENLTVDHMDEKSILVGDQFSIGEAIVEATVPRFPCFIFAERVGYPQATDYLNETEKPGVLFRVLKTGFLNVGDEIKLIKKSSYNLTMTEFLKMGQVKNITRTNLDELKKIPVIPKITLDRLEYRLEHGR